VIVVAVHDITAGRVRRDHDQRNARATAEEIEGLEGPRVPISAALVDRYEEGRFGKEAGVRACP